MSGGISISQESLAQRASASQIQAGKTRLYYIDNLRFGLIALVIVGHMAITYGAPLGHWYYREAGEVGTVFAILTTLLLGIGASFLLGLFYMIAGYFTPGPYDRKGAGKFMAERLIRLGIPLVLYALVINPLVTYWAAVHGGYQGSFIQYIPSHIPDLTNAAIGPLWFVEALLVFSLVYALGRLLNRRRMTTSSQPSDKPFPGNGAIVLFALGLGLVTFLVRIWAPFGWWWEPIHQEPGHFPQYIALFAVGILAYRQDWFARLSSHQARVWGWVALALVPVLPVLAVAAGALRGEFDPAITGGFTGLSLAYSMWEALVMACLTWFRNRFNHQGMLARQMSGAAYAVYVLHPLLIVPLALSLSGFQLALELKFLLVAPLAVALCFLAGILIRKIPLIDRVL
jgi:glucan biosynthesis protein C